MTTNAWLIVICAIVINAVLFWIGAVTVLSITALAASAPTLLPVVVVTSIVLAPTLAVLVAPRMRFRNWSRDEWQRGDLISG